MTALELQQNAQQYLNNLIPSLWRIDEIDYDDETEIESGDFVYYFDEDTQDYALGIYVNLWEHNHEGESSPFWGDHRTMAYIRTLRGATYADIETIQLADEADELDWLLAEMAVA